MTSSTVGTLAASLPMPRPARLRPATLLLRMIAFALIAVSVAGALLAHRADAAATPTLYSFLGGATDGANPEAPPVEDSNGNLWGTTLTGGASNLGTVWEITKASSTSAVPQKETIISFTGTTGANLGAYPVGGLCLGSDGNLYGTTYEGGYVSTNNKNNGTFFKVSPTTGVLTTLFSMTTVTGGASNGLTNPSATPVQDPSNSDFYFPCYLGGKDSVGGIIAMTSAGAVAYAYSAYSYTGDNDEPVYPVGPVCFDTVATKTYVFGTGTRTYQTDFGSIYVLPENLTPTSSTQLNNNILYYTFTGGANSDEYSVSGLIKDSAGNLYGTTANGGTASRGKVFKITAVTGTPTLTTLVSVPAGGPTSAIPAYPQGTLAINSAGTSLYGTTSAGGGTAYSSAADGGGYGTNYTGGNIFSVLLSGPTYANIYAFTSALADSKNFYSTSVTYNNYFDPIEYLNFTTSGLYLAPDGYYYGTGYEGGSSGNYGTVYKFGPPWTYNYTYFTPGNPTQLTLGLAINDYVAAASEAYSVSTPASGAISALSPASPITAEPTTITGKYTPNSGFTGLDGFTYTATNSIGTSLTGSKAYGNVSVYVGTLTASGTSPVTGTTATLTAGGTLTTSSDTTLIYTWATSGTPPAAVTFSAANGTHSAGTTAVTATFTKAGTYTFVLTATAPDGTVLTATPATVSVVVTPTVGAFTLTYTPNPVGVGSTSTPTVTPTPTDQFGTTYTPTYSYVDSGGANSTVSSSTGTLTAGTATGSVAVIASAGSPAATASATVTVTAPVITANPTYTVSGTTINLFSNASVTGTSTLSYNWTTSSGGVTGLVATATNPTVTISAVGTYNFQVVVSGTNGAAPVTKTLSITITSTPTTVTISPTTATVYPGGPSTAFTGVVKDQFGTVLTGQTLTWGVSGAAAGTITTGGVYSVATNKGTGSTQTDYVTAQDGTVTSNQATVTVSEGTVSFTTAASATPNPVTGTTTSLSAAATWSGGSSLVLYKWVHDKTYGGSTTAVSFSDGTTDSSNLTTGNSTLTATFTAAGTYYFYVIAESPDGKVLTYSPGHTSAATELAVVVNQTATTLTISPASPTVNPSSMITLTASLTDQFGNTITATPAWSVTSGAAYGSINASTGVFTATATQGTSVVKVTDGGLTQTVNVVVVASPPVITQAAEAVGYPNQYLNNGGLAMTGTVTDPYGDTQAYLYASATYGGTETYLWSYTGPTGATFSSTSAQEPLVTFTQAGTYVFTVKVTGADGLSVTSSVTFILSQYANAVSITPSATQYIGQGTTLQFTATETDQFGNAIASPSVSWSAGNPISGTGLYSGVSTGTDSVYAYDNNTFAQSSSVTVHVYVGTVSVVTEIAGTTSTGTDTATTGTTTSNLSVLGQWYQGAHNLGESNLTYTWKTYSAPTGGTVTYSANGTNAAKNSVATFDKAGSYQIYVTIQAPSGSYVNDPAGVTNLTVTVAQTLSSVKISPTSATPALGGTQTFTATAYDQFGNALSTQPTFTWSTTLGTINASGLYTATTPGSGTVTVSSGGFSATASVTVSDVAPTLGSITVNPNPVTGTTASLSVTGSYGGNGTLTYTWTATTVPTGGSATFAGGVSGAPNSAVTTTATFTKAGSYTVQVVAKDASGTSSAAATVTFTVNQTYTSVNVTPSSATALIGGTQQFTATAYDQFGNALTTQPTFTWSVTNAGGAASSVNSSGLLTAGGTPGTAVVKALSGTISDTASVTIYDIPPTLAVISITPSPVTGTTAAVSVTGSYTGSANLTYTWSATGPASVTFSPVSSSSASGVAANTTATFTAAGTYTIIVTVMDASGGSASTSKSVMVDATLTSVLVTPSPVTLAVNGAQTFTAVAKDQFGATITGQTFAWSSTGVGSVNASTGAYAAGIVAGTATVKATDGAVSGTASVTVTATAPTVATAASASPNPVTGTTTVLSVLGSDATGESNLTYTWTNTGTGVTYSGATNGTNAAKAITATFTKAGSYTFTVTISNPSGQTATSSVTVVVNQTATTVTVTPSSASIGISTTQAFTASAKDQFGTAITGQTFTWSSTGVGSIDPTGLYSAGTVTGTATVKATAGAASGTASVTVSDVAPTLGSITVNPNPVTGTSAALSATGTYAGGGTLTYTWSTTGTPPASVTFSGGTSGASGSAATATATFAKAGSYTVQVVAKDAAGASSTPATVTFTVNATYSSVTASPNPATVAVGGTQTFTATAYDQFGNALASQPTFTWSLVSGVGSITTGGLYTAGGVPGSAVVKATATVGSLTYSDTSSITVADVAPTLSAITSNHNPLTGTAATFTVTGTYAGSGTLTYAWSATGPSNVVFAGGTSGTSGTAVTTTGTFNAIGTYTVTVIVTDASGQSATQTYTETVSPAESKILTNLPLSVAINGTVTATATAYDQFGVALSSQPSFSWSVTAGAASGSIAASTGVFMATGTAGTATISVTGSTVTTTGTITVINQPPTVATAASATPNPVTTGKTTTLSVLGAYAGTGGEGALTYTWSAVAGPATPSFSVNGSNAAKSSVCTFAKAGTYDLRVTITDAAGGTTSSDVTVVVNQTLTTIVVTPGPTDTETIGTGTQTYVATGYGQFGNPMAVPPTFTWSNTGVGSVNSSTGVYTITVPGTATIKASAVNGVGTTITGSTVVTVQDVAPTVGTAASANPSPVTGTTTNLSVLGQYTNGESGLTYTWTNTGTGVTYSGATNGTNAAKTITATFTAAGSYTFTVTISDGYGGTVTSSVTVTVNQTATTIMVTPATKTLNIGGTQTFTATVADQFGTAITGQTFTWSNTGVGSINTSTGAYAAGLTPGAATVSAATGGATGSASVTVTDVAPTVATAASATPNPVTGTTTALSVQGAYTGGESNLTYTWAASPATGVTFSANGTNAAKSATATFTKSGSYAVTVTIADPFGATVTSSVTVTVNQTPTTVTVTPSTASLSIGGSQTFTATVTDQFGASITGETFTWSSTGVGSINTSTGAYTAGTTPGTATVTATDGTVSGTASVTVSDTNPTVGTAASATPNPVTAKTTSLSVLGAWTGGESNLTYTWTNTGTGVTYSGATNGTNAAKAITATFTKAGSYTFTVTIADPYTGSVTSTVTVTVNQTLTSISVTPNPDTEQIGTGTQQFTAVASDQFGDPLGTQPTFTWTNTGVGSVSSTGLYTIGLVPGTATITAASGSIHASATVTVNDVTPTVGTAATATPNPVTAKTTSLSVLGAWTGGESNLTYTWTNTGTGVTYSGATNGTNAAKAITVTFTAAGTYTFTVTISDGYGGSVTSSVTVTVTQAATTITVSPATKTLGIGGTQTFTATITDQFGTAITGATPTWSVKNGYGTITAGGLYTAGTVPNTETVEAAYGGATGDATVTVTDVNPTLGAITITPNPVTGTTAAFSATGTYAGSGALTYVWSTVGTPPAPVTFSGGTSGASGSSVTATGAFTQSGSYTVRVTVSDQYGAFATETLVFTVNQTPTTITLQPATSSVIDGTTEQLTASINDQFGNPLATQPTFTWSVSSGSGTVNSSGLYTAPNAPGSSVVTATADGLTATASVTNTDAPPTVATAASATPNPVTTGTTTNVSVLGAYIGGESTLTYAWTATGPGAVTFSANGTNAAKASTATFIESGAYTLTVTITDPYGQTATSSVTVTVDSAPSAVVVTPSPGAVTVGGTLQLSAIQNDQFGDLLVPQPTFTWSVTAGGGSVSSSGLFTAPLTPGTSTVTVTSSFGGSATVTITTSDVSPTIATAASASPNPVTGKTTNLTVMAAYAGDPTKLTYTWSYTGPGGVTYSGASNGTNGASAIQAVFTQAGTYDFTVTVANTTGQSVTSAVSVTVNQTLTNVVVTPSTASINIGTTQQFTATAYDQFGIALATQPAFTWTVPIGIGTVSASGLYTAPLAPGSATVKATAGSFSDTGAVTVKDTPVTVATAASATPNPVTGKTTNLSVLGAWSGGESGLTYAWTATGPASVTFSANGTNAAKNAVATFTMAGSYTFTVTITDGYGGSATSSVTVTVNDIQTSLTISPTSATINVGSTKQFTATVMDQFGNALTPTLTWTVTSGPGSVSSTGLYTAGATAGTAVVHVSGGGQSATATVTVSDVAPTVATAASATPNPVTAETTNLSVLGAYAGGESNLAYTWSLTSGPAAVTYSANATNAAKNTTATFTQAGSYAFLVTISTPGGLTVTSSVTVTVNQTATSFTVSPVTSSVVVNGSEQLTASVLDQFGNVLVPQPTITWTLTSGTGTVGTNGLYNAPAAAGSATVKAATGSFSATLTINIIDGAPTVATAASATPNPVTAKTTALSVLGAYVGGESNLTYTWSATGPAAVAYSVNGTNAAKNTTATFTKAGTYAFTVTLTTPSGYTATNTVTVVVNQTPTSVTVTPNPGSVGTSGTLQMTATSLDQFGSAISPAPAFTWAVASGGGSVSSSGLYTAPATTGTATVKATAGTATGTATVNIVAVGTISGTVSMSNAAVNLTTQGTLDWNHWGRGAPGLDQKSGGNLLSGYTLLGSAAASSYRTDPRLLSWTNGTPTASSTSNATGVDVGGIGNGFQVMSPAIGTTRTVVVYVGGINAGGTLTAKLSDGTTASYVNTIATTSGQWDAEYTITYASGSGSGSLVVSWVEASGTGAVTLSAVTLH